MEAPPFRSDFFSVVRDLECSPDPFERVMRLPEREIVTFSFYQLHYLSRYARTDEERRLMFERVRRVWLAHNNRVGVRTQEAPETTDPVRLGADDHADRVYTLYTVLAHYCACPLDSEGHISFASDFTREAFMYQHEAPDTFDGFVDPAQRYRHAISDPLSWAMFQLKARIVNRHLPFPPAGVSMRGSANGPGTSTQARGRAARRRITAAGYCDTFSIATDPASRAEAELRRRGEYVLGAHFAVPSLSELVHTLQVPSRKDVFAYACPVQPVLKPARGARRAGPAELRAWETGKQPLPAVPDEERFLVQLAYYHTLEMQRHYAQSRFAPWADEDTKPQLAALIARGQHYRAQLIAWGLLPEDAPWVAPPATESVSGDDTRLLTRDHLRVPRDSAQTSFALNPRYNHMARVVINTRSADSIEPLAHHYVSKEQCAPTVYLHSLFPRHYYRSLRREDLPVLKQSIPPNNSLLPGDTSADRFLPMLAQLPDIKHDHRALLRQRGAQKQCEVTGPIRAPRCNTLHKRVFAVPGDAREQVVFAEAKLLDMFASVLGKRPAHFRVRHLEGARVELECDDPAYLHYASLLCFADHLLSDEARDKPYPLHPLLLRLFAVRPRRHNFEHYAWEGPANGFYDAAHMYCFARVLAHWCNRVDPYLPAGVSPDRYLCTPADSTEKLNHYANTHKFIALFAAGDGTPVLDAIRERGLLANLGRFLTFSAAAYMHRDAYVLMQQWVQNQIAYSANTEFMRQHYWLLDHFAHPVEALVSKTNPVFIKLDALCKLHGKTNHARMRVTYALDGRGGCRASSPPSFALRLYRAAVDMRFIHHKLAILLATSLANEPDPADLPLINIDLVVEPEACDHELLDWQQFRSTSWVRAFLAERAVADAKGGSYRRAVSSDDVREFYAALARISPADAAHPHAFATCTHTQIDSDHAEQEALRMLQAGGRTEEILRASQARQAIHEVQTTEPSKRLARKDVSVDCTENFQSAYYRRMLFLAYRMRLDPDLAVCLPPAQRAAFRVGEPAASQTRPFDARDRPFDLEGVTYTSGPARLDAYLPPLDGLPRALPQRPSLPTEADLAGVDAHNAVALPWVHAITMQMYRLLPDDIHLRVLSASVASVRYPESRFSPSYSVTVEEETQQEYLVRLDACEMYMLYKAVSHVLPEELTHDAGEDASAVEQLGRFQQEKNGRRTTHIRGDSVACSAGTWSVPLDRAHAGGSPQKESGGRGRATERAERDVTGGVSCVLHYDDDEEGGLDSAAAFGNAAGGVEQHRRAPPRGRKRRAGTMHDTLDERIRPVAPSVRKYAGRQYRAYYVHNGLGAPSRQRVAFFCHGAYVVLVRASDRARLVETVRRQIPYDVQLDFGRLGFRVLPVDRFRETWGLRRRVAYAPADEVAPPAWETESRERHHNLNVGVERAQGYGTWKARGRRRAAVTGRAYASGTRASNVPARTFKFPRRKKPAKPAQAGRLYECGAGLGYYTNPASYWGLVDWMSAGGRDRREGDLRMTGDADALNPLLTVLAYLDAKTTRISGPERDECAPIDYLEYDYLGIAGPGMRDLPVRASATGDRPLTLSTCLLLKI